LVKNAGFEVEYCWISSGPFDLYSADEYITSMVSIVGSGKSYNSLSEEQKKELHKLIEEDFENNFKAKNIPIMAEMTMIVARKP